MTTLEGRPNTAAVTFTPPAEFTPLTRPVERGEMPLSGIR